MPLPTQFANNANPTGQELDNDLAALGAITTIPCTVTGTNVLALTPIANTPTVSVYNPAQRFSGVVSATNTTAVTAQVGSLAALNVYKDSPSGPVVLSGNELIANNAFTLVYDAALNTGVGGFHLISSTLSTAGGSLTGSLALAGPLIVGVSGTAATLKRLLSVSATVAFTPVAANSTQDQNVTLPGVQIGDSVSIGPPSTVLTGVGYSAYVPAAGTVTLRAINATAASLTPTGGVYRLTAMGFT